MNQCDNTTVRDQLHAAAGRRMGGEVCAQQAQSTSNEGLQMAGVNLRPRARPDGRTGPHATHLAAQAFADSGRKVDPDLLLSFAQVLERELSKPWLGNATTGQLIDELRARSDLGYRSVNSL